MSKQYTQTRNRVIPVQATLVKSTSMKLQPSRTPSTQLGTSRRRSSVSCDTRVQKPLMREQTLSPTHASFHAILLVRCTKSATSSQPLSRNVTQWKERVVRVTKPNEHNDGGSIEVYRLERDKNPDGEVGDLLFTLNLKDIDQVAPGCISEGEKKRFLRVDPATQKLVPEYLYGHVLLQLTFLHSEWSLVEFCCYSSAQRDEWYDFFTSLVYDKEYLGLLAVPGEVKVFCQTPECPREAVNRFFTLFMSQKPLAEVKEKETIDERDEKDTQQLQFLAKRFDVVLIQDENGSREHARIECPRPGLISVHGKRDFAVERGGVFQDPVNPDVFYLRPKRSDVVARDLGVQLTDGCLQIVATSDAREFRQWLAMLFGGVSRKEDMYLGEMHFSEQRSPSTDTGSAHSDDSANANRASLLASSIFKSHGIRQRAESTCLVYLQYNVIGQPPSAETSFRECFSVLHPLKRRWYFVKRPPSKKLLVELFFDDITAVSGYSELYGMAGFTIHAGKIDLELHVVPQDSASRNDWMRTVAECRMRVVKGKTREEWNAGVTERPLKCALCNDEPTRALFCAATCLPHVDVVNQLADSSCPSMYLNILRRRTVTTTSAVDSFLAEAKDTLRRGMEAKELLSKEGTDQLSF